MNLLFDLLDESYSRKAAGNLLLERKSDEHPTTIADLKGSRVVVCNETSQSRRLAEALVKDLTGGDRQKARFMRQDYFEFTPSHKIFLYGNHKPVIKGRDPAIWDRIKLIPFEVRFEGDQEDKTLNDKLTAELPGFLAWCVQGCLKWQAEGLESEPEAVRACVADYRKEMDDLGDFIEECIEEGPGALTVKEVYEKYAEYLSKGERPPGKREFNLAMEEHGYKKGRLTGNKLSWLGIKFKENELSVI